MTKYLSERPYIVWPAIYNIVLFFCVCALWWVILVGGNPYHVGAVKVVDQSGIARVVFHRDEWIYVKRYVCSDHDSLTIQSPVLYDLTREASYPLIGAAVLIGKGCGERGITFQVPAGFPLGAYEYRNVSRYQNNLIGRDEWTTYPPIRLMIVQ
jgi:hypothetical protein